MKMASPKTEREKAVIDKISNLPAFEPLNASDFYGSCEAENLYVKIQANSSREAAIKMGLMFIELSALRNIFPGPVSSKNVVMDRLPYGQKFLNDRNSKICYHSLKDHPKVSKIAKFRCEML